MLGVYAFCAIVGIPLVLIMAFFGGDTDFDLDTDLDVDLDFDTDLDADMSTDIDTDLDLASSGSVVGEAFTGMLSVRALLFAMAGFGSAGLISRWTGIPFPVDVVVAGAIGFFFAYTSSLAMAWLKRSETNSEWRPADLQGHRARVTLPVLHDQRGKVTVAVAGKPTQLLAKLFNDRGESLAVGDEVVVVEVDASGTALIARLDSLTDDIDH